MAKLTLTDFASLTNETSAITTLNNNNTAIENALENTLSRDGTSPNSMSAQLDMNTNKIINLPIATGVGEALEYTQLQDYIDETAADRALIDASVAAASASATAAFNSAGAAAGSAEDAADILIEVQNIFDTYNNQYLGTFAGDPTVDNDGNPLTVGDIWYNSITLSMRVWDGTQAQDVAAMTPTSTNTITNKIYQSAVFRNTFVPETNDGAAIGTTSLKFSDLFLASGAVINFNSGDVTLTHSSNNLAFAGASTGYTFDAKIYPTSNDGAPLGDTTHNWSDLFLASGAVINFNNGDVTLTHGTNSFAFAGADSGYSFDNTLKVLGGYGVVNGSGNLAIGSTSVGSDNISFGWGDGSGHNLNLGYGSTGTFVPIFQFIDSGTFRPVTNDGAILGDTTHNWSDLFLASGAVVNFANGNYTLTHSSGLLNFSGSGQFGNTLFVSGGYAGTYSGGSNNLKFGGGGSSPNAAAIGWGDGSGWVLNLGYNSSSVFTPRYQFVDNGAFRPATSDAAVLGDTTHMWSDLFLASGGVVNFNNGDFTLTHSSGILTANKDIQITTAGTNSTSVATVGGTQTLTNKTINLTNNTLSGTTTQFNTALNDDDFATLTNSVTLTNKTLTSPVIGTIVNTGTLTLPTATSTILSSTGNVNLTGGFTATSFSNGTVSSGTLTPAGTSGNFQHYTNNGAHTLAPPASPSSIILECLNGASAGAITTSGFTKVTGDTLNTTNTNKFLFFITKSNSYSHLHVQALQ